MRSSLPNIIVGRQEPVSAMRPLHLLVLLSLAAGAVIWGATFIFGSQGLQLQRYLALLGLYGISSAVFVASRIRRGKLQLFELPVFMTAILFFEFGLTPLRNFIDPAQLNENLAADGRDLVQALAYVILGTVMFWIGCELARPRERHRLTPDRVTENLGEPRKASVLIMLVALYAASFGTRLLLLENQLFSFVGSMEKYYEHLASMQVLNAISQLGTLAVIVVAIERYRARRDPLWRMIFVVVLSSELLWGLISGSKGSFLQNLIVLALVSSFVQRRLNLRWLVIAFFALVLFYPFSNAYRSIVHGRDAQEITSFAGAARAGQMAFSEVGQGESSAGAFWREGLNSTLGRVDLLTSVAEVLDLGPRASMVKGNVHWWMLPIYPFVPRFLWPSKPILEEGGWFTVALRGGSGDAASAGSSTAVTYPGDLYLQFGLLGILVGMLVLGVVTQWFTNRVNGTVEPRDLFVYTAVFLIGFPIEADVFSMWTGLIKLTAILYVLRWLIYGAEGGHRRQFCHAPVGWGAHERS
jgi:hypothetical protein